MHTAHDQAAYATDKVGGRQGEHALALNKFAYFTGLIQDTHRNEECGFIKQLINQKAILMS
mgnify:CR=1 FL=1